MPDDDKTCNIYLKYKNRGRGGFFGTGLNGYEGIPQNLVLNIVGWMIMILVFSVIRKKAWNYGRLALVQRTEQFAERVSTLIFGRSISQTQSNLPNGHSSTTTNTVSTVNSHAHGHGDEQTPTPSATTHLLPRGGPNSESPESLLSDAGSVPSGSGGVDHNYSRIVHSDSKVIMDTGYFSWIKVTFSLTDQQYMEKCGFDCVQYLSFQRHLIFLACIMTLTSLVIVLPINYQGTPLTDQTAQFNQTTIINLKHDPKLLWVHVILAIAFLFLSIAVMRHFSRALKFVEDDPAARRSIMIVGISRKFCMEDKLRMHFEEIYPDVELSEVTFAYDITELQKVEFSRQTAHMAIIYWEEFMEKHARRPTMTPYYCGAVCWTCSEGCGCCGCCDSRDAIEFYSQEEVQYTGEVTTERERALEKPLGIAFVTFKTVDMAERVVSDHRLICKVLGQTPQSKFSQKLKSRRWTVNFAPLPMDMYWENLTTGLKTWYLKVFLVNIILAVIVAFYTTPVFLLQAIIPMLNLPSRNQDMNTTGNSTDDDPQTPYSTLTGLMIDTIPTLLLWIVAVTLPSLVSVSDKIIGFWTKTGENRSRMIKVFSFLIFMVVILPSFGLTSLTALINKQKEVPLSWDTLAWECVFSKDNGALFVNYICTSTFLGTASELMRLPELLVYSVKLCFARSAAEIAAIRQSVLWDFQIGSQYAWMMLNFAIFSVFSVIFPIVTPFGLIYLVFKHYVDRYNIYFAYGPTKVEKEVHGTAINFVIVCMFILQINLLAYVTTQGSGGDEIPKGNEAKGLKVFCVVGFCITAALFISQIFFNMCANFSPILYSRMSQDGLNLNPVQRNGDAISTSSASAREKSEREMNKTDAKEGTTYSAVQKKNLDPQAAREGHKRHHRNGSSTSGRGHVRNLSNTNSEDGLGVGGRRKYFPKLLQPPRQKYRYGGGAHPSPAASVNSVVSAANAVDKDKRQRNQGHLVTAVVVNENVQRGKPAEEKYLLDTKRPLTNSTV